MKGLVPKEPTSKGVPHVWRYAEMRELLLEAGHLLTAEEAERRVLVFENPALPDQSRVTPSLYSGLQLIMPFEEADVHRHAASALRLILESDGGYTDVAGERTMMRRGDFVTTPNWATHGHGNLGDKPVIWVDGLDLPLVNFFEAGFSQSEDEIQENYNRPEGDSMQRYGRGLVPFNAESPYGHTSPIFNYPYERSREALMAVASVDEPDKHFGHQLRYANPIDGGWAMPTLATWLSHLPKGFETKPSRSTDGQVVIVVEGEIEAEVGGKTLTVGESDVLAVPGWMPRRYRAGKDTVTFTFSDRGAQEKLGLWREDRQ
jgi:gentisate 1,2-dioxygenase